MTTPDNVTTFSQAETDDFSVTTKIALLVTVDGAGLPHVTFIPNMQPRRTGTIVWGQLMEGMSKDNVRRNPKCSYLFLTLDRKIVYGKAQWSHQTDSGEEFDRLNALPMYRYNAYINLSKVHFMQAVDVVRPGAVSIPAVLGSSLATMAIKPFVASRNRDRILKVRGEQLFNSFSTYAFIAWIDHDKFPRIHPLFQCRAADSRRIVFALSPKERVCENLYKGQCLAVYGISTRGESLLVRGTYNGLSGLGPFSHGTLDIHWVYNSNPPIHGQIYPPLGTDSKKPVGIQ